MDVSRMARPTSDTRLRIIVLGFLVREPTGGLAWAYLNYLCGLMELGHDVYYLEDSSDRPSCYGADLSGPSTDPAYGLSFAARVLGNIGLGDRWGYYDAHTKTWQGPRKNDALVLCQTAELVLNVSGYNPIRDWLKSIPARAIIDIDPGFTQIRNLTNAAFRRHCADHTAFFSIGKNIGKPSCLIPDDGFPWQPIHQPVSLSAWPHVPAMRDGRYTTVMTWESSAHPLEYGNLRLEMKKSVSFAPLIDLPSRVGSIFELAIRARSESTLSMLRDANWGFANIDAVSSDPWTYQEFIQQSRAELGITTAGYLTTRCGWFSERSIGYLASGRPVLQQDTGFPDWLPCGAGVFAFRSAEEAAQAIARIESDYDAHCRAARELAEEYFAAPRVLNPLIEAAMSSVNAHELNSSDAEIRSSSAAG
jgi:hypothetical protein